MTINKIEVEENEVEVTWAVRVNGRLCVIASNRFMAECYATTIANAFDTVGVKYEFKGVKRG